MAPVFNVNDWRDKMSELRMTAIASELADSVRTT
jgi:hypothetical protein